MVLFKMVAATDSFRNTLQKSHIFLNASLVHAIPLHETKCDIQVNSLHKPSHFSTNANFVFSLDGRLQLEICISSKKT